MVDPKVRILSTREEGGGKKVRSPLRGKKRRLTVTSEREKGAGPLRLRGDFEKRGFIRGGDSFHLGSAREEKRNSSIRREGKNPLPRPAREKRHIPSSG